MNDISKHIDKNTPLFYLNNKNFKAKVVNIIAPNILKIIIEVNNTYIKLHLKLNNVSCNNNLNYSKALNYLCSLIMNDCINNEDLINILDIKDIFNNINIFINIHIKYFDKSGCIICDAYKINDIISISEHMINSKLVNKLNNI